MFNAQYSFCSINDLHVPERYQKFLNPTVVCLEICCEGPTFKHHGIYVCVDQESAPIIKHLTTGWLPGDKVKAACLVKEIPTYVLEASSTRCSRMTGHWDITLMSSRQWYLLDSVNTCSDFIMMTLWLVIWAGGGHTQGKYACGRVSWSRLGFIFCQHYSTTPKFPWPDVVQSPSLSSLTHSVGIWDTAFL